MSRFIVRYVLYVLILIAGCGVAQAQTSELSQTITLKPGWNAIHVALEPSDKAITSVFAGIPVRSVWRWIPGQNEARFIRDPAEGLENIEGWFAWFPEPRPDAMLTNLFTIDGDTSYLVRLPDGESPRQLVIHGTSRYLKKNWRANDFTLTGLPVVSTNAPTFNEFFSRSPAHQGQPIYRLDNTDGRWKLVAGTTPINANEAYWFYTNGNSRYQGRMDLVLDQGESLEYSASFSELRFVLRNLSGTDGSFQIERIGNTRVPLSIRVEDEETHEVGWPDLHNVEVLDAPAGEDVFVTLAVKRSLLTSERMEQALAITDENGQRILLHVGVNSVQPGALSRPAGAGVQAKAGGDNPLALAGLWVGHIDIDQVSEAQRAGVTPKSTGVTFSQRILIHVNAQGQARLLKDVIQMWEEGTTRPSSVDPSYQEMDTPGRYVLITNKDLIGLYGGVAGRDGTPVGIRLSTVGYDFDGETLDFSGVFGPGGQLTAIMEIPSQLPTNPFLHRYHPDHDNLDEHYLDYQEEAFQVVRNLRLEFTPDDPLGGSAPDWGDSVLGGTFSETITGLHRNAIHTAGTFRLTRASAVTVLNQ